MNTQRLVLVAVVSGMSAMSACMQAPEPPRTVTLAETNCLNATSAKVGGAGVSTISATPTEAGTTVVIQVEGGEAPWTCVATHDGSVQDVSYGA